MSRPGGMWSGGWKQCSLRVLLLALSATAIFFAGFRAGYYKRQDPSFEELIELISASIEPNVWEDIGGPGLIEPFESRTGCVFEVVVTDDESDRPFGITYGAPLRNNLDWELDSSWADPFARPLPEPLGSADLIDDPFADPPSGENDDSFDPFD